MADLLKGKAVADSLNETTKAKVNVLKEKGIEPCLAIFRIGENPSDLSYEKGACKKAEECGVKVVKYVFEEGTEPYIYCDKLEEANIDPGIHGILMFRPLPKGFDEEKIRNMIDVRKDVDACSDMSLSSVFINSDKGYAPCTARAVIELLDYYNIDVKGKNVVVLGRSLVIGKPVGMMLLNKNATLTICHSKTENLKEITKNADIVIAAIGKMEMLDKSYFKKGQTVIDVGIHYNEEKQKLCGDVLAEEVESLVKTLSPVPGGIGSITSSVLIRQTVEACEKQNS
ncbi:MAG: bifunctional 5,10-methylenetetrahydrofolate dehydrogenase/5,10-methenyltetrahydrofolate cyclohydrolase [Erysipelotrichaceae bacterium]|nr:bifunctional 5,10-methylenetetrahydrofolate dehydrogenase/5,10-methenyltetrahydrofolate cyclohydrolase [Erysipelotrichaceae bacterium]